MGYLMFGGFFLFAMAAVIPQLALTVRRLHDQDSSGLLILFGAIPYVGGFILLVFMIRGGTRGPNRYGDDPRETRVADAFA